jgi:hypothetical protein
MVLPATIVRKCGVTLPDATFHCPEPPLQSYARFLVAHGDRESRGGCS